MLIQCCGFHTHTLRLNSFWTNVPTFWALFHGNFLSMLLMCTMLNSIDRTVRFGHWNCEQRKREKSAFHQLWIWYLSNISGLSAFLWTRSVFFSFSLLLLLLFLTWAFSLLSLEFSVLLCHLSSRTCCFHLSSFLPNFCFFLSFPVDLFVRSGWTNKIDRVMQERARFRKNGEKKKSSDFMWNWNALTYSWINIHTAHIRRAQTHRQWSLFSVSHQLLVGAPANDDSRLRSFIYLAFLFRSMCVSSFGHWCEITKLSFICWLFSFS